MTKNKLAIIGGSGLYDVEESKEREFLKINTPWGQPSDEILKIKKSIFCQGMAVVTLFLLQI